ncbi:hypothetical protein ATANTOWER_019186 [Ataeniobius toweri]|uniref:Uncharacterized protein n=1 Tax=Ataeniobius toweri TaxID=208326 RepID=A0ABU7C0E2_9TELE|nr:hypothetical protein [Ataeniobius toweri]
MLMIMVYSQRGWLCSHLDTESAGERKCPLPASCLQKQGQSGTVRLENSKVSNKTFFYPQHCDHSECLKAQWNLKVHCPGKMAGFYDVINWLHDKLSNFILRFLLNNSP